MVDGRSRNNSVKLNRTRRQLIKVTAAMAVTPLPPGLFADEPPVPVVEFGSGTLHILSDGNLSLPTRFPENDTQQADEMKLLLSTAGLSLEQYQPPCNITLWKDDNKLVLFDIGSGSQFMDSVGLLPLQLESIGVDPADITDVVFTHAHPDHCWGLIDDFDELFCPEATYHMHRAEFDYWMSDKTLNETPEAGLGMVAGARNRLPLIRDQLEFFSWGDEVLPGIEAIDTSGHTPGHTSFALHQGNTSLLVLGDALTHPVFSFQRPQWHRPNDIDAVNAAQTRVRLLERLAVENALIVAFHLPDAGYGRVDRSGDHYQFVAELG